MPPRKLDELATDIDDAKTTVEELQSDATRDLSEKLDDLHRSLEDAAAKADELEEDHQDEDRQN